MPDMPRTSIHAGRTLPTWYDDAKLGVFLHWGLYSVPGWAPQVGDIQTVLRAHGPAYLLSHSPYAEWYLNSMRIPGSDTERHHREVWHDQPYAAFAPLFEQASADADLDALAAVCASSGARYVVLTTKHHEGYCLWPTDVAHPVHGDGWRSRRDLVGDLAQAVRARDMRMGLYYSGGIDWSVHDVVIRDLATLLFAVPQDDPYPALCDAHLRELVDRYAPDVLWNDIAMPAAVDLDALFAHYYAAVPDGVVNDRWAQGRVDVPGVASALRAISWSIEKAWPVIPSRYKSLEFSVRPPHHDFTTPEYAQKDSIERRKWESTRGVGHSFGANRNEHPADIVTATELVRSFVDIVAKGGNLLIGIGPEPDGSIPSWQQAPLRGLGDWLAVHGDAVFGTRPWTTAEGRTAEGTPLRFTQSADTLHVVALEAPATRRCTIWGVDGHGVRDVTVGGLDTVDWVLDDDGHVVVELPERMAPTPALALHLTCDAPEALAR